jgi:hypothetical protein
MTQCLVRTDKDLTQYILIDYHIPPVDGEALRGKITWFGCTLSLLGSIQTYLLPR